WSEMLKYIFDGMNQSRPWNKKKPGNNRGKNEFEEIDAGTACSREHSCAQRLELSRGLHEHFAKVGRRELPRLIGIIADHRPSLDRFGRRGNCDRALAQAGAQHSRALGQTKTEPRRRTEHDKEAAQGDYGCGERAMPEKFCREPPEDRIEHDRDDGAPDQDRQEWPDQNKGPIGNEPETYDANCQNDECFVRCAQRRGSTLIVHRAAPFSSKTQTSDCTKIKRL